MTNWLDVLDKVPTTLANRTPEDVLYHYTSQTGLLGIIEKKKLWATHIRYLNDSQEFDYAIALARRQLEKERNSGHQLRAQFAEKTLDELGSNLDISTPFAVWVASFSRHCNQLSQWRAYCPPEGGFSLGFKVDELRVIAERRMKELDLAFVPCLYEEDEQNDLIAELISTARTTRTNCCPQTLFAFLMLRWAPAIKHGGFHEEEEWRLIAGGTRNDSRFRQGLSFLVPYIEFDLAGKNKKLDCVESVTVGPTRHPELSEQSVRDLLDRHCADGWVTSCSKIPFRNW